MRRAFRPQWRPERPAPGQSFVDDHGQSRGSPPGTRRPPGRQAAAWSAAVSASSSNSTAARQLVLLLPSRVQLADPADPATVEQDARASARDAAPGCGAGSKRARRGAEQRFQIRLHVEEVHRARCGSPHCSSAAGPNAAAAMRMGWRMPATASGASPACGARRNTRPTSNTRMRGCPPIGCSARSHQGADQAGAHHRLLAGDRD